MNMINLELESVQLQFHYYLGTTTTAQPRRLSNLIAYRNSNTKIFTTFACTKCLSFFVCVQYGELRISNRAHHTRKKLRWHLVCVRFVFKIPEKLIKSYENIHTYSQYSTINLFIQFPRWMMNF